MCSRSCTRVFSEPTYGLKVSFVYVYKTRLLLHKATTLQCVCALKRSIRSGELRRKPFPPQPIFGARSHRRKRNSFGLQVFSLRDYKTIHNITVRCREKRHVRSLIDTFPSIKCLPNTKVKTAVQRKHIKN